MAKRYIDADGLLKYKEREVVDADKISPTIRYVVDTRYIEQTPTADVVERKRGEWIRYANGTFVCSECGKKASRGNFCPHCGADMREPPKEETNGL